MHTSN